MFPTLKNDLIIRAALCQPTERDPVWVMRQAGRYLPEFRKLREQYDFFKICQTPDLACEITLQPIRRYAGLLDAAIIFSDILVVPQAMGMQVEMLAGTGPHFPEPLQTDQDVEKIIARPCDVHKELEYVFQAITLTRQKLEGAVPLIGFTGAPWTLLAYMIEGGGSKTFQKAKVWLWTKSELMGRLLTRIAEICAQYLVGQIEAGAQLLQVFDSWAGELSPRDFQKYALPYLTQIATSVRQSCKDKGIDCVPLIVFAKGANQSIELLANAGYDVVALDWTISAADAQAVLKSQGKLGKVALQGNLDPSLLYADHDTIEREVKIMCDDFGREGCHVANLGHGITPAVDPENMRCFLAAVHKYSKR